ncbi:form3 [Trypoxylus dichotomus]
MDYTVPYIPQLNGKAKRLNRTFAERIRSLLIDSELEKNMCRDAAFVAMYLLYRSPTAGMKRNPIRKMVWTLWDDEKQKIIFARDVVFKETRNTDTPRKEIGLRWPINDAHYEENKKESETLDENSIEQDQENDENLIQDNEENSQEIEEPMQSKRSERRKKLPKYLEEYELDVENISCMTYEEAVTGQNRHEWLQTIEEEKKSLIENNTWEEVDRQEAGKAKILNEWVLRI